MNAARLSFCVVPLLVLSSGCFDGGSEAGVLNRALHGNLPDQDGDGLYDILPPDGVAFEMNETVGTVIRNTVTFAQAAALTGATVPEYVADWVTAEISLLITYEDGSTQTIRGTFAIEPFELRAEIACPIRVEARATVLADVPFFGPQTIAALGPIVVDDAQFGAEAACGTTFELEIGVNEETGLIDVGVSFQ